MTKAAIYARISKDRTGEGMGVARQLRDCRRLAKDRGWDVVEEYIDNDQSAYKGNRRPQYEAMMSDLEGRVFDAIVVYHQDRLTRTPAEFEAFLTACQTAGLTKFTTVTGYTDLGQGDGVMVARIFAAVAANQSDAASRRIRRKNDERAEQGLPHESGYRPFGYEADRVTVREDEAEIVRSLVARFLAGESIRSLLGWLDDNQVPTVTGRGSWRTPTLRSILASPRIAGLREHRGEVVGSGAWPALITQAQHRLIVSKLGDPARKTSRSPRRYALSGIIRCGACGARMVAAPSEGRRRYGCRTGSDFGGCGKVYVTAQTLDAFVADAVLLRLDGPEMAAVLKGRRSDDDQVRTLTDQAREDRDQLDELARAYADRQIPMTAFRTASKRVESRLKTTEKRLARLAQSDALEGLIGTGSTLRTQWGGLPLTQQAAIIAAVIDHVVIHPAKRASNRLDIDRVEAVWRV